MAAEAIEDLKREISRLRQALARSERALKAVRLKERFLDILFEGIQEEILIIDRHHTIQAANRTFLERHGLQRSEALGRKCHQVLFRSALPCRFGKRTCPLDEARRRGNRIRISRFEVRPGGERREITRLLYPIAVEHRPAEYFLEIAQDVTEYRRLLRHLKASEHRYRAILDTASDAIVSIDESHRIVLFNDAAERIFGYTRTEVLGRDLNLLIPPSYRDHRVYMRRYLETRSPRVLGQTLSLSAIRKNGEEFPIELALSHVEWHEGVTFTAIIRDLSRQKQLERKLLQSERLAAVGQAVAHVAHEIKSPLTIIGGFSRQIRSTLDDFKTLQKLDMICHEVARLEKLVNNLGDFTKEYHLEKRPANINAVILDVLEALGQIHSPDRYRFEAHLSPEIRDIRCDPDKLKQVFMNVITNGLEAMQHGGCITIRTEPCARGVDIQITDEGEGIAEHDLLHIFEQFYTTRKRGSGLGLSISYRIVEAHGGEIWAVSEPGCGTTFFIRLPEH